MGSNIVRFDAVRSVPIASITASYTPFGSAFGHAMRVLHFINDTNGTYMFSFDGVTDNFPILAESFSLYDLTSDEDSNESLRYQSGSQLYIRTLTTPSSVAGTTNTMYAVAIYGKGE
jgi:hypothetical protein